MTEDLRRPTFIRTGNELVTALQARQGILVYDLRQYQKAWLNLFTPPAICARVSDLVKSARALRTVRLYQFEGLTPDRSERVYVPIDFPAEATHFTTQATFFGFLYTAEIEEVTASEGVVAFRARYTPLGRGEFGIKPRGIMYPEYRVRLRRQFSDPFCLRSRYRMFELTRFRGDVDKINYYVCTNTPGIQSPLSYEENGYVGIHPYSEPFQRHLAGVFGV